jgi:hypothetical protein
MESAATSLWALALLRLLALGVLFWGGCAPALVAPENMNLFATHIFCNFQQQNVCAKGTPAASVSMIRIVGHDSDIVGSTIYRWVEPCDQAKKIRILDTGNGRFLHTNASAQTISKAIPLV